MLFGADLVLVRPFPFKQDFESGQKMSTTDALFFSAAQVSESKNLMDNGGVNKMMLGRRIANLKWSLFENVVLKTFYEGVLKMTCILEYVGTVEEVNGETDSHSCLLHPQLMACMDASIDQISVESLKHYGHSLESSDVVVEVEMLHHDKSLEMSQFLERVSLYENKCLFRKQEDFFSRLIKSKLVGKYVLNGQLVLLDFMGISYAMRIRIRSSDVDIPHNNFVIITKDVNVRYCDPVNIANTRSQSLDNYKDLTSQFVERVTTEVIGGVRDQLEKITSILGTFI